MYFLWLYSKVLVLELLSSSSLFFFCSTVKLGELQESLGTFEHALELAKLLEDSDSQKAIITAVKEVDDQLALSRCTYLLSSSICHFFCYV